MPYQLVNWKGHYINYRGHIHHDVLSNQLTATMRLQIKFNVPAVNASLTKTVYNK